MGETFRLVIFFPSELPPSYTGTAELSAHDRHYSARFNLYCGIFDSYVTLTCQSVVGNINET